MSCNLKKIFISIIWILFLISRQNVFAVENDLVTTEAQIEITSIPSKDLDFNGTVFGELLKQEDKKLVELLETNGDIKLFVIQYVVKDQQIIQSGMFRAFPSFAQKYITNSKKKGNHQIVTIHYSIRNPVQIFLLIDKKLTAFPALITKIQN